MCGIVGSVSSSPHSNRASIYSALVALKHRGPDDCRYWHSDDGRVAFGHRRLAIIDLSPLGSQPMRRGPLTIVFNGEIYNFLDLRHELQSLGVHFVSQSDTEVILYAYELWGLAGLERLEGMFAFALHDAKRQIVHLMRDRAGEKPLFYRHDGDTLRFASELKGLLVDPSLPRRLDFEALDCFLGMGFVPGSRCILQGYNKLPPAHRLSFDVVTGQYDLHRYWQPPPLTLESNANIFTLADQLEGLLYDAVKKQLVADVPVGVLLSGGVDSSLITALACRIGSEVRTFTVGVPSFESLDEKPHARLIADYFGTQHTELNADPASVDLLPLLARQFDEPIIDSSMLPTFLVSRQVRRYCKVALGGDGGDELFGGYSHYSRLLKLQRLAKLFPLSLRASIRSAATNFIPSGATGRNWLQAFGTDFNCEVPLIASYFDSLQRQTLLARFHSGSDFASSAIAGFSPLYGDLIRRATLLDFATYLPEDILVKIDRASMLESLELRAPMLDQPLLEFAFGRVPSCLKSVPNGRKLLLKELARRLLPPDFDLRRKQGFSIPLASWLRSGPWLEFFRSTLLDTKDHLFDRRVVEGLFAGQQRGRNNGERLFGLVMFELWRREYCIEA